jgi:hypothetical protein
VTTQRAISTQDSEAQGLRIGITIGLHDAAETLWNNGIKQNAAFLAEALRNCPQVGSVVLVNTTPTPITNQVPWSLERWPTQRFEDAKDRLDVLIELGGQIGPDQTAYLKSRGTRLVSYCCGFEYIHAMEAVLFGRASFGSNLFVNQRYDDIWMIPQVAHNSEHFFTTLRRRPARVAPFVWDPVFLEERSKDLRNAGVYRPPAHGPRRISVMEPNIDVVKFCLYPIFIVEEAFRLRPDLIGFLHVTNAERLATKSAEFIALMNQLDLVRQHKAAFVARYETPRFLADFTDVMVSHQWDNPLNYFYLEVCWQGYPLVHNAELCTDLGYYYPANDVPQGASTLIHAIEHHDEQWDAYRKRQRKAIQRFLPDHPALVSTYSALLHELMQREPV